MAKRKNKKLKVSVSLSRLAHAGFGDLVSLPDYKILYQLKFMLENQL